MAHRVLAIILRRLLACLTILSLLLCLATLALWARSYWRCDSLLRYSSDHRGALTFGMMSEWGELHVFAHTYDFPELKLAWHVRTSHATAEGTIANFATYNRQARSAHFFGFGFGRVSGSWHHYRYAAPHWFIALLFAALPAVKLRSILRTRRRDRVGLCQHCGYDLRATAPDGVCPECGETRAFPSKLNVRS